MTKLRKLTALLLAGALALLLLTACGGGGGSASPEAQAEANVMRAINNGRAVALSNDPGMQKVAAARLDAKLKGNAFGYSILNKVGIEWDDENENGTITLFAKYDYKDTTLENIIGYISKGKPDSNLDINLNGEYIKVGVAARTIQGQTYVAISLRVGKNL